MKRKKCSRIAFFAVSLLLLSVLIGTLPISAAEPTEQTDYDAYYAKGAKIAWDAFDRHTGDTHTEEEKALFKKNNSSSYVGTFGEGYLSVKNTTLDFTELFANDGKTDYTIDLTVAMQGSYSCSIYLGALYNFQVGINHGISATDKFPVDASFGIVSNTYRAFTRPDGTRVEFATDVGWKPVHFLGKPLGKVYSFGVSTDYTIDENETGTAVLSLWRDAAVAQSDLILYPVTTWGGSSIKASTFRTASSLNFDFYALRYYERALTAEEYQLNHFVDLAKWFKISLDTYDTYSKETKEALHLALREETFDTLTKSSLQSTVDSFGIYESALNIDDYINFEGFSAALYGAPGLRSIYEVNLDAVKMLEKAGYTVSIGALVAVENGRDIADITCDTLEKTLSRTVYQNGEFINSVIESDENSFRFALTTRFDSESSSSHFEETLLYRAFMTLEKDGAKHTLYLDAEGDTFGHSVSIKKVSLLLAFLGNIYSTPIQKAVGEDLHALARAFCEEYAPIYKSRAMVEALALDISDYLFASYDLRADIMTNTGISKEVYTYEKASPYYKLFTTDHVARNVNKSERVPLLLECENAAATVNFAATMTSKLYEEVLSLQTTFQNAADLLDSLQAAASAEGLSKEDSDALTGFLSSCIAAHKKAIDDSVRDVTIVNTRMQAVKETLEAPTDALAALRAKLFDQNDIPAFGTEDTISSYVILSDAKNKNAALMLTSILSDRYGIFVPYFISFPKTAEYTHTISLFDASNEDVASLLGENDYLLAMQGENALLYGKTSSDAQLAAVIFSHALTPDSFLLQESTGRDVPELFNTDLPAYLQTLSVKAVEDGGVMDRFNQVLLEMPDEYKVLAPISSADYPLTVANTVYVSPNGSDSARGTYYAPFKTLERAFEYALGKGGAQILLFGGTYKIDKTLSLTSIHSGTKQSPLYISAMPDEEVIFTTADTVLGKDFAPVSDESVIARLNSFKENNHKNVYVADLKALGIENYGKITTSGEPLFLFDGVQYNLARYPNKNEALIPLLTPNCLIKQSQVTTGSSYLYADHKTSIETQAGWKIRIDDTSAYRDRMEKWTWTDGQNTAESIWLHGALYEEWHRAHYPLVFQEETINDKAAITMSSTINCSWGVYTKTTGPDNRNGYFYNILEELDTDGEWYLDHTSGKLYVYSSRAIKADARATMVSDTHTILTLSGASNIVLNGITLAETLGRGLTVSNCENILIQNCTFRDTRSNACLIEKSYNSGVIHSDFSRVSAGMLSIQGTADRSTMTPDRLFVQNCHFHHPNVQTAVSVSGISCLVSHNLFEDTTITFGGAENILEYNEFARGSQITYDSGPIYCSGPSGPKGNHIRYNYLHDLNFSYYGIYIDDLSSDNYVYSNIVSYASNVTKSSKGVNIHNGHQNVVYNNILINAKDAAIRDNANYYVKYVYDASGNAITTYRMRYYTDANGNPQKSTNKETGGGLGYRWDSLMSDALKAFDKAGGSNKRYAERFPNLALYMELTRMHLNASHSNENYKWDTATVAFDLTETEGKYFWGDESLFTFLSSKKDTQDIEVYLRSPAYNEYIGNVFIGCATDIFAYTPWGLQTTNIQNNHGLPATSEYYTQAMTGDLSKIAQASTWQSVIPEFESIPYEKFGRTEKPSLNIHCPIISFEEDFDFNMPFDDLFSKQ